MRKETKLRIAQKMKAPITKNPATVLEEAKQLCARLEALHAAEESAQNLLAKAEADVGSAKRNYAAASAKALMQHPNGHLPALDTEQEAMIQAKAALEQAELSVLGCRQQSAELDREALVLREKLRGEVEYYRERTALDFLKANSEVIAAYKRFLLEGQAMADALGIKLTLIEKNGKPPHPLALAVLNQPEHTSWNQDRDATALHNQHCEPYKALQTFERLSAQAEWRAKRPDYFPTGIPVPRQRYRVRSPLKFDTKILPAGTIISAFNLPGGGWGILKKLASTRHIQEVEIE